MSTSTNSRLLSDLDVLGKRRDQAQQDARKAMADIRRLARRAHRAGIQKSKIAQAAGISRPTLDELLRD